MDNDSKQVKTVEWDYPESLPESILAFADMEADFAYYKRYGTDYYLKSLRGFSQYYPLFQRFYMVGFTRTIRHMLGITEAQVDSMYVSELFGFRIVCEEE